MSPRSERDTEVADLGNRMAKGTAWVIFLRLSIRSLGVLSTVILARLLEPADYGLVALATGLAAAVELISAFNFEIWLIRHTDPQRDHYDTVWTLSLLRGGATAILLWLIAIPMSTFFDEPRLDNVIRVIAAAIFISSWQNIGIVDFQRQMRFHREFVYFGAVKLGAFVVTVTLGVILRSYWALIAGIVASHLLTLIISYRIHPFRPRISLTHWREVLDFSKWLLVSNALGFVYMRADTFILGKVAGSRLLGLYSVAREIADLATTELVMPIRRVMVPGYSTLQHDTAKLSRSFVSGFGLIMLVGMPCAVGISLVADPLIRVMLGTKWVDAIPIMQALVIYGVSSIGMANQWPALIAMGRIRLASALLGLGVILLVPSFYFAASQYGVLGGVLALGVSNVILFIAGMIAVRQTLLFRWRDIFADVWRIVAATLTMVLAVAWLQRQLMQWSVTAALVLATCVLVGACVYAATLSLLWKLGNSTAGPEQVVVEFVREKIGSWS